MRVYFLNFVDLMIQLSTEGIVLCLHEKYEELFILMFHNISKKVHWPILYANLSQSTCTCSLLPSYNQSSLLILLNMIKNSICYKHMY